MAYYEESVMIDAGVSTTVSQVAAHYDTASDWGNGAISTAQLLTETGWDMLPTASAEPPVPARDGQHAATDPATSADDLQRALADAGIELPGPGEDSALARAFWAAVAPLTVDQAVAVARAVRAGVDHGAAAGR